MAEWLLSVCEPSICRQLEHGNPVELSIRASIFVKLHTKHPDNVLSFFYTHVPNTKPEEKNIHGDGIKKRATFTNPFVKLYDPKWKSIKMAERHSKDVIRQQREEKTSMVPRLILIKPAYMIIKQSNGGNPDIIHTPLPSAIPTNRLTHRKLACCISASRAESQSRKEELASRESNISQTSSL